MKVVNLKSDKKTARITKLKNVNTVGLIRKFIYNYQNKFIIKCFRKTNEFYVVIEIIDLNKGLKMLIGLISDTHIPDRGKQIPSKVFDAFSNVDLILHAGDLTSLSVISELEKIAPVMAIQGNMDRLNCIDLPKAKVIEAEGLKIGIVHGEVYPRGDSQQLFYLAQEIGVDILVSGHSHQPKIEKKENVLLINPGSPIVPRLADRTVMILEINNKEVDVEIVKVGAPVCSALDFDQYKRD